MRKIIRYASISWNKDEWKKSFEWYDEDTGQGMTAVSSNISKGNRLEEKHIMYELRALKGRAGITITSLEPDVEKPTKLSMTNGAPVYIGNGFIHFETNLQSKD